MFLDAFVGEVVPDAARGGECPLCGALTFKEPSRLEEGAPSRVRYAL